MCLPLKFLKCWVWCTVIFTITAGIIVAIAGLVFTVKQDVFFGDINNSIKLFAIIALILGAAMILFGSIGACGVKNKNGCCLFIFQILLFIVLLFLLILGAIVYVYGKNHSSTDPVKECRTLTWISDVDDWSNKSYYSLCSEECPCYLKNTSHLEKEDPKRWSTANITNSSGATNIYACNRSKINADVKKHIDDYGAVMQFLEKEFKCSGICSNETFYVYWDINAGFPEKSCIVNIMDELKWYADTIGIILLSLGGLMVINVIFVCCFCFHPENSSKDFISRSNYYYAEN